MFVKLIIKTLHVSVTIVWPSSGGRLSCLVLLLPSMLVCVVKLFICVCGFMLSMCVRAWCTCTDVGCLVVNSQPNITQTSTSGTHTHRQNKATYQVDSLTTQIGREGGSSTKHERRPPEDGQTIVTETCRILMMCFTNIFNNLEF